MADLKEKLVTSTLSNLLHVIFGKDKDWLKSADTKARHRRIAEDHTFKNLMEVYKAPVKNEVDRYDPFCQLANHVISLLLPDATDLPLMICRNDRVKVLGSSAARYPDCVGVHSGALKDTIRKSPANLANAGPTELPFGWHEVLTFFEFKLTDTGMGKKLEPELSKLGVLANIPGTQKSQQPGSNLMEAAVIESTERKSSHRAERNPAKRGPGDSPISPQDQRKKLRSGSQARRGQDFKAVTTHQSGTLQSGDSDSDDPSGLIDQDDGDSDFDPNIVGGKQKQKLQAKNKQNQSKIPTTRVDYAIQCASYGLEMLAHSAPSTHRVGFLINDDKIQFQSYDRTRCAISPEESFIQNPYVLIEILDCLTFASRKDWGFLDAITPPQKALPLNSETADSLYLSSSTLLCSNGATLELEEVLFRHHAIVGRGTCVVSAKSTFPGWVGKSLIVKISFTPTTRLSEGSYLTKILDHAEATGEGWVKDHLTEKLHFETLSPEIAMATQVRLSKYIASLKSEDKIGYELRNVQILVTTKLHPIKDLHKGEDLRSALTGIVKCYKWVFEATSIMHRDISVDNLMYRFKNGKIVGVLNDFDLAIFTSQQSNGPMSKQRTGTRPFMAYQLLEGANKPQLHLYRHDLESFMYVILVLACYRLASDEVKKTSPFASWFDPRATPLVIGQSKYCFLDGAQMPIPTETMTSLSGLVKALYDCFCDMVLAIHIDKVKVNRGLKLPLDEETLGGAITMHEFARIFDIL